jgi:hypothetical protein
MSRKVEIEKLGDHEFRVRVIEGATQSSHRVTLTPQVLQRLTDGKTSAEDLVRRSFEFLLEREPKESILGQFKLEVIARYFPQYEREIKRRLANG